MGKLAIGSGGTLYVARQSDAWVKIVPSGTTSVWDPRESGYNYMYRPAIDQAGNVYSTGPDLYSPYYIRKYTPGANSTQWMGNYYGYTDGVGTAAGFATINGMVATSDNQLLVIDGQNYALRQVNIAKAEVTTLFKVNQGYADGTFAEAKFWGMLDIALGKDGAVYILEANNNAIRKVYLR